MWHRVREQRAWSCTYLGEACVLIRGNQLKRKKNEGKEDTEVKGGGRRGQVSRGAEEKQL